MEESLLQILPDALGRERLPQDPLGDLSYDLLEGGGAGLALLGGAFDPFPFQGHPLGGGTVGGFGAAPGGFAVAIGIAGEPKF
jgi:hypothetical protein